MKWIRSDFKLINHIRENLTPELVNRLDKFHIHTLEDLIALWEIAELREHFAKSTGVHVDEMERLVAESRRKADIGQLAGLLKPVEDSQLSECQFGLSEPLDLAEYAFSTREEADGIVTHTQLPTTGIDHIGKLKPIQNQGRRGTCVGFGTTVVREFLLGSDGPKLSEQFLYWGAKQRDGHRDQAGTYIRCAVDTLQEIGICRDQTWPYNPDPGDTEDQDPPPREALEEAPNYKIIEGIEITGNAVDSMRAILAGKSGQTGRVISFGIPVFRSWYQNPITFRTGKIPMPLSEESHIGGHCMTMVGFKDDDEWPGGGYFIFRNSWGEGWASESEYGPGYGTVPYLFIARYGWEAWSAKAKDEKTVRPFAFNKSALIKILFFIVLVLTLIFGVVIYRSIEKKSIETKQPTVKQMIRSHSANPESEEAWTVLLAQSMPEEYLSNYPFKDCFVEQAERFGLPLSLIVGLAREISYFEKDHHSSDNRIGVLGIKWPLPAKKLDIAFESALRSPCKNIRAGCQLLANLLKKNGGKIAPSLIMYYHQDDGYPVKQTTRAEADFITKVQRQVERVLSKPFSEPQFIPLLSFDGKNRAENYAQYVNDKIDATIHIQYKRLQYHVMLVVESDDEKRKAEAMIRSSGISNDGNE